MEDGCDGCGYAELHLHDGACLTCSRRISRWDADNWVSHAELALGEQERLERRQQGADTRWFPQCCAGCQHAVPEDEACKTCKRRDPNGTDNWEAAPAKTHLGQAISDSQAEQNFSPKEPRSPLEKVIDLHVTLDLLMNDHENLLRNPSRRAGVIEQLEAARSFGERFNRQTPAAQELLRQLNALLREIAPVGK
jgi:hypothetical protein